MVQPSDQKNAEMHINKIDALSRSLIFFYKKHHESETRKKMRIFTYKSSILTTLVTTVASISLALVAEFQDEQDTSRTAVDISGWVFTTISLLAGGVWYLTTDAPNDKLIQQIPEGDLRNYNSLLEELENLANSLQDNSVFKTYIISIIRDLRTEDINIRYAERKMTDVKNITEFFATTFNVQRLNELTIYEESADDDQSLALIPKTS